MSEFTPITTQEELDKIIEGRLARQKESYEAKLTDYDQLKTRAGELETENVALKSTVEDSNTKLASFDSEKADLNAKIAGYETATLRTKVALKHGLPFDLADRLVGEDEASMTKDAERLAAFIKPAIPVPPLKSSEAPLVDKEDSAYKSLVENLNLEGE